MPEAPIDTSDLRIAYSAMVQELLIARSSLKIIKQYNPLRSDRDAFLYAVAEYGLCEELASPNPEDYGLPASS